MKRCSSCKIDKPFEGFDKNKAKLDGYHNQCKACRKQYTIDNDINRKRWADPVEKEKLTSNRKGWGSKNKEYYNEYMRNWNAENRDYSDPIWAAYQAKRRQVKRNAIPVWVDNQHLSKIARIYKLAGLLTTLTGVEFEVDHIYPLQNPNCTGLHVWWNLQVLPKQKNRTKGNKLPSENIISPRVSEDSFEEFLQSQFKIYADLYQIQDIELQDKKLVG